MKILLIVLSVLTVTCFCRVLQAQAEATPLMLPFYEPFSEKEIDPSWTQVVSDGSKLSVDGNWLIIESVAHSSAHIQRPLGQDLVTVSAKIWGTALYLAWDAENGCGMGRVSPTPFPRFFISQTLAGKTTETHLRGAFFHIQYFMRLQLGKDCIRFFYNEDGGDEWRHLRTIPRPKELSGPPRLIAFGNYYGEDDPLPFSATAVHSERAPNVSNYTCFVDEISIEKTPEDALYMTDEEKKAFEELGQDPVGKVVLQDEDDPTYEQVEEFYPPFQFPREVVGVPEHPLDIGVDYQGRLDVSPWDKPYAWIEIGDPPKPFGETPIIRRLEDAHLPIVKLSTGRDAVDYEMTVFGWSENLDVDSDLFAYLQLKAESAQGAKIPESIALVDARSGAHSEWPLTDGHVCLRFKYPEPASAEAVAPATFEQKRKEIAEHWRKQISLASRIDVPDKRINDAYKAWVAYSLLNADTINGYLEPRDGSGFYEEMFGYSVSLHTMAADLYGMHDYAERVLATQLHFQEEDGKYVQATGLPDLASLLIALKEHYLVTRDIDWLRGVAPNIQKGCEWLVKMRKSAPKSGPMKGMIKYRPYCDYPTPVYNFQADMYACTGLAKGAEALRFAGLDAEAERFAAEAKAYGEDIVANMEAAAFQDGELTVLPIEPETRRLLKLEQYNGGGYYGLVASMILEIGFLEPEDKQAYWLTDMLEKRGGLIGGVCDFYRGVDHAYTYGYLMTKMRRDEIRNVVLGLWGMMAFGMTRDTYSPVEINMVDTGENHLTLPHLYSCTQQLRLLRNMLLCEEGDVLWIGRAIPRQWLEPGKHVEMKAAPTHFGEVSYRIDAKENGDIVINLSSPQRERPSEIRIRLRHPEQSPIKKVEVEPEAPFEIKNETIMLRGVNENLRMTVSY